MRLLHLLAGKDRITSRSGVVRLESLDSKDFDSKDFDSKDFDSKDFERRRDLNSLQLGDG